MIKSIAMITFLEGVRNKALYGITVMAGLMMALTVVLSGMIMKDVGKVATDLTLSASIFAALIVVLFVGINILARDLDRKTVYLPLSRSVPRSTYLIARYLGLGLLLTLVVTVLLASSLTTLFMVKKMYANYFGTVSFMLVVVAHLFVLLQMWLLSGISILFSMVASSSFITFTLTTLTWLIGSSTQEVKWMLEAGDTVQISTTVKVIAMVAYYIFPNFTLFDLKPVAAHGLTVNYIQLGFTVVYAIGYSLAVMSLAVILFNRKELN